MVIPPLSFPSVSMIEYNDFSVLAWNIRGAANGSAKRHIRELLRVNHPSIVFLFETKVQFSKVRSFWRGQGYVPVHIEEARGRAGGIWCLRQENANFSFAPMESTPHAVTIHITSLTGSWFCTGVYANPHPADRDRDWEYLKGLRRRISEAWMVVGDFRDRDERAIIVARAPACLGRSPMPAERVESPRLSL